MSAIQSQPGHIMWRWIITIVMVLGGATKFVDTTMADQVDVWIGTGGKPSQGIYHCVLDTDSGKLTGSRLVAEISAPGFLAMHPEHPILYAIGGLNGQPVAAAYQIAKGGVDAELKLLGSEPIGDGGATHLSVSKDGRTLLTAQYGAGSVAAFKLSEKGHIAGRTQLIQHTGGSKAVVERQDKPHAHWIGFSPDQRFALVPDLGLDQVVIYRADTQTATLTQHGVGALPAGAGPRHLKFHPNGKWIYVLNELDLTVSLFNWDATAGTMNYRQSWPTVDAGDLVPLRQKSCSEIRIHPNGKVVYAANRGHDTISVFRCDQEGLLSRIQIEPVRGATPRNFNLDSNGKWLLAAGQDSHTLASFAIDNTSGKLIYNHAIISTPSPICILMMHE